MRTLGLSFGKRLASVEMRISPAFQGLLAAVALATALVVPGAAARAMEADRMGLKVNLSETRPGTVHLTWTGPIAAPMASQIRDAFESRKGQATRFVLRISSQGGHVPEGERVIEVMRQIRATHQLDTAVTQGDLCASMCVFIYLQGQKRFGAMTSSWLFHEVSHVDLATKQTTKLDRAAFERLVDKYMRPAGVSAEWIADMQPRTVDSDYWQTGADLIRTNSGIINETLGNQTARAVAPSPAAKAVASTQPPAAGPPAAPAVAAKTPGECRKYFPSIGTVVPVPCS
jgi:ATP-dependent protease ClpP protease subunit